MLSLMYNLNTKNFDLASEAITTLQSLTKKLRKVNEKVDLEKTLQYFDKQFLWIKQIPHVLFKFIIGQFKYISCFLRVPFRDPISILPSPKRVYRKTQL